MSDQADRFRFIPICENNAVLLGINVSNGNRAVLFVLRPESSGKHFSLSDTMVYNTLQTFMGSSEYTEYETAEIDHAHYDVVPWSREFDKALAELIDNLVKMRMQNAAVLTQRLQMELPL
jgi:hypothetical protein